MAQLPNGGLPLDQHSLGPVRDFQWHCGGALLAGLAQDGHLFLWGNSRLCKAFL